MFRSILALEYFEKTKLDAENNRIKKDRDRYKPIFDMVYEIIKDKDNIILGDLIDTKTPTNISIYTVNAIKLATSISNMIHKKFGKYVKMSAILPNKEYGIMYNMRHIITVHKIQKYKNTKIKYFLLSIDNNLSPPNLCLRQTLNS